MNEVWKPVVGYEGRYEISNLGNVKSLITNKLLKPGTCKLGYKRVVLRKEGKSIGNTVHRMVANAFLENKGNLPCVNHKDENPSNNMVDNLEWCTYKYNNNYGDRLEKIKKNTDYKALSEKKMIAVAQYDLNDNLISYRKSAQLYKSEFGYDNSWIAKCCKVEGKVSYGYKWKYLNEDELKLLEG